jgi:hypothetical protein
MSLMPGNVEEFIFILAGYAEMKNTWPNSSGLGSASADVHLGIRTPSQWRSADCLFFPQMTGITQRLLVCT